jgi:hypothetical protein
MHSSYMAPYDELPNLKKSGNETVLSLYFIYMKEVGKSNCIQSCS